MLNNNLAVSGWVGLAYDRQISDESHIKISPHNFQET